MSRSGGSFDPRHEDSAALVDVAVDAREEELEEGERPGLQNSDAARQARAAREQRRARREQEEAEDLQDPRLRALAAALPPPPPPPPPRTYGTADGVDGGAALPPAGGDGAAPAGDERGDGAAGSPGMDGRGLLAPPPPPPCAPPLDQGWRPVRRDE